MKNTLEIYKEKLPKLANDFIYYAQCNPNKYKVVTRVDCGILIKVYKKPFNTLLFEYFTRDDFHREPVKYLRFFNNNHDYWIDACGDKYTNFYVYDELGAKVLEQTLENFEYSENLNYYYEDFVRIYDYFLKDQGYFENENTLF